SAENYPFTYEASLARELAPYLEVTASGPKVRELLATIDRPPRRTIDFLVDLNRRLSQDIAYIIRLEPGVQTPEETLARGSGSRRGARSLLPRIPLLPALAA